MAVTRTQVLAYRATVHGLGPAAPGGRPDIVDFGVQDTGPDGAGWALLIRGWDDTGDLASIWSLRGAPHQYRRSDLGEVAAATSPYSEADAAKQIFDAAKPLRESGIPALEALDEVAARMREIVTGPMVKGDVSGALSHVLPDPYLRFCRSCGAVHIYEMPFRLASARAGLELERGTSPPVLRPSFPGPSDDFPARLDVIRGYLHFFGPATARQVADYLGAPVREIRSRWPEDVMEIRVGDTQERRWILTGDHELLTAAEPTETVRLLGPFDPYLQSRDREMLVDDPQRRKALWPTLGRPGAVLLGGELIGTWRPRKSGDDLVVRMQPWADLSPRLRSAIEDEAQRLAAYRAASSVAVTEED